MAHRLGVTEAVLLLGYEGSQIKAHLTSRSADSRYPRMDYVFDGPEFLGTGGAILNAKTLFQENFIVTYGDSFLLIDAKRLFQTHLAAKLGMTFSIYENHGTGDTSNVLVRDGKMIKYDKFHPTQEMH